MNACIEVGLVKERIACMYLEILYFHWKYSLNWSISCNTGFVWDYVSSCLPLTRQQVDWNQFRNQLHLLISKLNFDGIVNVFLSFFPQDWTLQWRVNLPWTRDRAQWCQWEARSQDRICSWMVEWEVSSWTEKPNPWSLWGDTSESFPT